MGVEEYEGERETRLVAVSEMPQVSEAMGGLDKMVTRRLTRVSSYARANLLDVLRQRTPRVGRSELSVIAASPLKEPGLAGHAPLDFTSRPCVDSAPHEWAD